MQFNHNMSNLSSISNYPIEKSEYIRFVDNYKTNYSYSSSSNELGLRLQDMTNYLNKYIIDKGYSNITFMSRSDYVNLSKYICDSLDKNYPLALKVGYNFDTLGYKITYPYENKTFDRTKKERMGWHYIVITGIDYDVTNGKCELTFSSWSGKGTFIYDDVINKKGIFEGVVYIE